MIKIQPFTLKKSLSIMSDLLILLIFPVVVYVYRYVLHDYSIAVYYSIIFIIYIFATLSIYIKLYTWRKLDLSVSSFIFFFINTIQLTLYIFAISILFGRFYNGIANPIYLPDLSVMSQYRYLALFSISFFFIIIYLLSFILKLNIQKYLSIFSFPYLHEEIRYILDSWKNASLGKFILSFIVKLTKKTSYRYLYCCLDLLSVSFRFIMVLLFISFCFFGGDFNYLLYFLPITFLFWLLSFFIYYINWIIEGNSTVIREWLQLSSIPSDPVPSSNISFSFKITPEGYKQGFTENDLPFLVEKWLLLGNLATFFQYKRFVRYFSFSIVILYFISWCYLTYYFFYMPSEIMSAGMTPLLTLLRKSLIWKPPMRSPRDARYLYEGYHNPVKIHSNNEFAVGHPVYGELLPDGNYRIDGYLTRDTHYGVKISTAPIVTNKAGNNQNAVPFSKPLIVPANYITPAVSGSMAILEAPGVKAVLDHVKPKE